MNVLQVFINCESPSIKFENDIIIAEHNMEDLDELDFILRVKVKKSKFGFSLKQAHYVAKSF